MGLAAACVAVGLGGAALVGLWLAPLGGEPSRALQVVAALAPLALVALVWRRRSRAARWLRALDAFAAREIARAQQDSLPGRRTDPTRTGVATASLRRVG